MAEGRSRLTSVIDIAAVDDHPIVVDSVAGWVMATENDIRVIGTAATVDALLSGPGRRAGAGGYVRKNEQPPQIRSAIREAAAGRDWISASLAYIFATDDAVG